MKDKGELRRAASLAITAGVKFSEFGAMAKKAYIEAALEIYPSVLALSEGQDVHRNTLIRWGAHKRNWTRRMKRPRRAI